MTDAPKTTRRKVAPPGGYAALIAGQAQSEARFDEVFRRLGQVERASEEARDIGREIVTTLREQDALARIAEVRAEQVAAVQSVRADLVKAWESERKGTKALEARVEALEELRKQAEGAAKGAKWLWDILKIVAGAGGGAVLLKLLEQI